MYLISCFGLLLFLLFVLALEGESIDAQLLAHEEHSHHLISFSQLEAQFTLPAPSCLVVNEAGA